MNTHNAIKKIMNVLNTKRDIMNIHNAIIKIINVLNIKRKILNILICEKRNCNYSFNYLDINTFFSSTSHTTSL